MKQIDGETLLEVQKQQERLSKESLKKMMIQAVADATGLPNKHLTVVADKAKKAEIVDKVKPILADVAVGDDDVDEFRSSAGDSLLERSRMEEDKKDGMAQAVAETLSQSGGQTPMHYEAVGIQAQHDVANRGTEMTPMRYEKELRDMETAIHEHNLRLAELRFEEQSVQKKQLQNKERDKSKQHKSSSSSNIGDIKKKSW